VQERAVWSLPCEARSLTAGEIPTPVRQDDNTGIIGSLFHQAGGDDIRHDPLMVAALDACARTYSTDAPPRCGIASAHIMKGHHELCRQCQPVKLGHHPSPVVPAEN
jgi:hypothetical protein